ncbi:ATP-dependent RNA helicase DQX1 [Tupaia chinensis]|uniref:ATP-dependent RNA helicase DQX1 n=1 Tax=Tupaia chinensis TaxID=246437 RepID=L9KMP8_TUPCH|nr:ATP-dependent RNA helicase DQX1 [Tupaia chinensis]
MTSQPPGLAEESGPSLGESELALNPFDGLPYSSRYYKLLEQRRALPIWAARFIFLEQLESSPSGVVLVCGEPGSGKSTQIPQWCAEFALARGFQKGQVTVTQPSPQAALSLALRVADEMDLTLGHEVGYSIPQEDCTGPDTLLRFCWDRLLLQEVASTRGTGSWGVLVLDEVQERSVASDSLQGLLRDTSLGDLPGDPKVVVVTDQAFEPKLRAFWDNPPVVHVPREPGESPIPVYRDTVPTNRAEAACQAVLELCQKEDPGDVLVYLPSEEEISLCCESLSREAGLLALQGPPPRVLPLHPGCGQAIQAVYEDTDTGARKVVVTHWLADFSFSLPSIRHVIDSGMELRSSFLELEAPLLPPPRVWEENLSPLVLLLKRKQIAEPGECHFLDLPAPEALMQALEDLDYLAALDDDGDLSDLGIILSEFPLAPELAKALLASCEFNCVDEMLTLAAMLTAAPGFTRPPLCAKEAALRRALEHADGDHSSLIQVYEAFIQNGADETWCQARGLNWAALCQARKLREELLELMQRIELPLSQPAFGSEQNRRDLQKALVSGYFLKCPRRPNLVVASGLRKKRLGNGAGEPEARKRTEFRFYEIGVKETRGSIRACSAGVEWVGKTTTKSLGIPLSPPHSPARTLSETPQNPEETPAAELGEGPAIWVKLRIADPSADPGGLTRAGPRRGFFSGVLVIGDRRP